MTAISVRKPCINRAPRRLRRPASPGLGGQCGLTLIEVLVALAIIAIALGAVIRALSHQAGTAAALDQRLLAGWSADNALVLQTLTEPFPDFGTTVHSCPQGRYPFTCTEIVTATPDRRLRKITVVVRLPDSATQLATLSTLVSRVTP